MTYIDRIDFSVFCAEVASDWQKAHADWFEVWFIEYDDEVFANG